MHTCALPHLHRDWARACHICTGTGLAAATAAPGLGYRLLPHLSRGWNRRAIRAPAPRAALLRHDRRLQAPAAQPHARGASPRGRATPRRLSPQRRWRRCAWAALLQRNSQRPKTKASESPRHAVGGGTRLRRKLRKAHSLALGARALALCMRQPCADDVEFILRAAQRSSSTGTETVKSNRHVKETHETRRRRQSMDGRMGRAPRRGGVITSASSSFALVSASVNACQAASALRLHGCASMRLRTPGTARRRRQASSATNTKHQSMKASPLAAPSYSTCRRVWQEAHRRSCVRVLRAVPENVPSRPLAAPPQCGCPPAPRALPRLARLRA